MTIEFFNTPQSEQFNPTILPTEKPAFLSYTPDFEAMEAVAAEYSQYENVLVIGHGGSITSFYGFYNALKSTATKKAYFLSTVDPDYIYELKQQLKPENTVVVAISKSGETVTQLEALNQFLSFPLLFVTGRGSTLEQIAHVVGGRVIEHPAIGGRYTGFTEVGLLPALLCGLNPRELFAGAQEVYKQYEEGNLSWQAASVLWQLEQKGYVDVFMPFYSKNLFSFSNVEVQLCHESFGKNGKGQTYLAFEAPESQHHTNQRFFGGIKNMAGFFISAGQFNHPTPNSYPDSIHSVALKGSLLGQISGISLEQAMQAELHGTLEDAKQNSIPVLHMEVENFSQSSVGSFLAFWHLFAVYSSLLRQVDPFDQAQVEASKRLSYTKRLALKEQS